MAICDSDCDPSLVTYPIPANDDAVSSVELIARTLSAAAQEGMHLRTHPSPDQQIAEQAQDFVRTSQ